jgi:hypothetical protein
VSGCQEWVLLGGGGVASRIECDQDEEHIGPHRRRLSSERPGLEVVLQWQQQTARSWASDLREDR